jgi:hypothetical protein
MDNLSLAHRVKALLTKARQTDAAPHTASRTAEILLERREALALLPLLLVEKAETEHSLATLTTMVYEHVETSLRDTIGFPWMSAFPDKSKASRHFQSLHAIARFLKVESQKK